MPSIGELFIQLGVLGNANELKKANLEFQKANILAKKQAELEKLRAEYLERINKAQDKAEKRRLAQEYRAKKALIEQKATLDIKNLEQKALKANIAQWATYAHAVTMAASVVIGSVKKIYDEIEKVTSYGQQMINIGMTTSTPLGELQKYGRVAEALGGGNEAQIMQQMAKINQLYDFYKAGNPQKLFDTLKGGELAQLGSAGFYRDVLNNKVPNATAFFERLRTEIQGKGPERQVNILRAAGLDESLLPLLRMGRGEFESYAAELQRDALTEEQLKQQSDIKRRLNVFQRHFEDFKLQVFGKLAPVFENIMQVVDRNLPSILGWIESFIEYIKSTYTKEDFKAIIDGIAAIVDYIEKILEKWGINYREKVERNKQIEADKKEALEKGDKAGYVNAASQQQFEKVSFINEALWKLANKTHNPFLNSVAAFITAASAMQARDIASKEYENTKNITNNIVQNNTINDKDAANRVMGQIENAQNGQVTGATN